MSCAQKHVVLVSPIYHSAAGKPSRCRALCARVQIHAGSHARLDAASQADRQAGRPRFVCASVVTRAREGWAGGLGRSGQAVASAFRRASYGAGWVGRGRPVMDMGVCARGSHWGDNVGGCAVRLQLWRGKGKNMGMYAVGAGDGGVIGWEG